MSGWQQRDPSTAEGAGHWSRRAFSPPGSGWQSALPKGVPTSAARWSWVVLNRPTPREDAMRPWTRTRSTLAVASVALALTAPANAGSAPVLRFLPSPTPAFGSVAVGQSLDQTFTLKNTGGSGQRSSEGHPGPRDRLHHPRRWRPLHRGRPRPPEDLHDHRALHPGRRRCQRHRHPDRRRQEAGRSQRPSPCPAAARSHRLPPASKHWPTRDTPRRRPPLHPRHRRRRRPVRPDDLRQRRHLRLRRSKTRWGISLPRSVWGHLPRR